MKYFVSVGLQAGKINPDGRLYVIHDGELLGLPFLAYSLWSVFQNVNTYDNALKELGILGDENIDFTKFCFNELRNAGLIVTLTESTKGIPYRLGTGIGFDKSINQYVVISSKGNINLSFLSYALWCQANGNKTLDELKEVLIKRQVKFKEDDFLRAFFSLLRTDALMLA